MKLFINIEKATKRKLVRFLKDIRRMGFKMNGCLNSSTPSIKPRKEADLLMRYLKVVGMNNHKIIAKYIRGGAEGETTEVILVINFNRDKYKEFVKYRNSIPKMYKTANDKFKSNIKGNLKELVDEFLTLVSSLCSLLLRIILTTPVYIIAYCYWMYKQMRDYYKKH